jgi:2-keto-4-pentenoate hydratase/2-oxohepta-3-ene-1,7-dioic acid hydratase in catechol pathway
MRWARFAYQGAPCFGVVDDDGVEAVEGNPFEHYQRTGTRIALDRIAWLAPVVQRTGTRIALDRIAWLAPVVPANFYCVGLNYAEHVMMHAKLRGEEPVLPSKPDVGYRSVNALTGHDQPIVLPPDATDRVEYEGELVCVVGREARHLTRDNALDCLLGYTIGNDVSERSWQAEDRTLWRAKNCDTFKPMGPWIETDFDLAAARTRVRLNGEQCIDFKTDAMLFGVVDYLVAISRYMTLQPGDVLWMGTEGHAEAMKPGDVVEVEITGIGTLRNPVIAGG